MVLQRRRRVIPAPAPASAALRADDALAIGVEPVHLRASAAWLGECICGSLATPLHDSKTTGGDCRRQLEEAIAWYVETTQARGRAFMWDRERGTHTCESALLFLRASFSGHWMGVQVAFP